MEIKLSSFMSFYRHDLLFLSLRFPSALALSSSSSSSHLLVHAQEAPSSSPLFSFGYRKMSAQFAPEHVCYVHCNFCNTVLAVSVPGNSLHIVTVRCGHCANLLAVDMGALLQTVPLQDLQNHNLGCQGSSTGCGSSSWYGRMPMMNTMDIEQQQKLPVHPPEKRQRVPSAYNRFIKEEIRRIKATNPNISHREAFSTAAKNWAHFPHIHFGQILDGNKQVTVDESVAAQGGQSSQSFY